MDIYNSIMGQKKRKKNVCYKSKPKKNYYSAKEKKK